MVARGLHTAARTRPSSVKGTARPARACPCRSSRSCCGWRSVACSSPAPVQLPTIWPVAVQGTKQRLVLRDVLLKRKAVVLVGLLEARLTARSRHARHVEAGALHGSVSPLLVGVEAGTHVNDEAGVRTRASERCPPASMQALARAPSPLTSELLRCPIMAVSLPSISPVPSSVGPAFALGCRAAQGAGGGLSVCVQCTLASAAVWQAGEASGAPPTSLVMYESRRARVFCCATLLPAWPAAAFAAAAGSCVRVQHHQRVSWCRVPLPCSPCQAPPIHRIARLHSHRIAVGHVGQAPCARRLPLELLRQRLFLRCLLRLARCSRMAVQPVLLHAASRRRMLCSWRVAADCCETCGGASTRTFGPRVVRRLARAAAHAANNGAWCLLAAPGSHCLPACPPDAATPPALLASLFHAASVKRCSDAAMMVPCQWLLAPRANHKNRSVSAMRARTLAARSARGHARTLKPPALGLRCSACPASMAERHVVFASPHPHRPGFEELWAPVMPSCATASIIFVLCSRQRGSMVITICTCQATQRHARATGLLVAAGWTSALRARALNALVLVLPAPCATHTQRPDGQRRQRTTIPWLLNACRYRATELKELVREAGTLLPGGAGQATWQKLRTHGHAGARAHGGVQHLPELEVGEATSSGQRGGRARMAHAPVCCGLLLLLLRARRGRQRAGGGGPVLQEACQGRARSAVQHR